MIFSSQIFKSVILLLFLSFKALGSEVSAVQTLDSVNTKTDSQLILQKRAYQNLMSDDLLSLESLKSEGDSGVDISSLDLERAELIRIANKYKSIADIHKREVLQSIINFRNELENFKNLVLESQRFPLKEEFKNFLVRSFTVSAGVFLVLNKSSSSFQKLSGALSHLTKNSKIYGLFSLGFANGIALTYDDQDKIGSNLLLDQVTFMQNETLLAEGPYREFLEKSQNLFNEYIESEVIKENKSLAEEQVVYRVSSIGSALFALRLKLLSVGFVNAGLLTASTYSDSLSTQDLLDLIQNLLNKMDELISELEAS